MHMSVIDEITGIVDHVLLEYGFGQTEESENGESASEGARKEEYEMGGLWLDQDLTASENLKVELREDRVVIRDGGGDVGVVILMPRTRQEAILMAIAIRKTYKRLEELAVALPDRKGGRS